MTHQVGSELVASSVGTAHCADYDRYQSAPVSKLRQSGRRQALWGWLAALVLLLVGGDPRNGALAQVGEPEEKLELASREIAMTFIQNVDLSLLPLWKKRDFPLKVSYQTAISIEASPCGTSWRQQFLEYIKFMNANGELLVPTGLESADLQASFFIGTPKDPEFPRWEARYDSWATKPGVRKVFVSSAPTGVWASLILGRDDGWILFSAFFYYIPADWASPPCFPDIPLNQYFGAMLLPGFDLRSNAELQRRYQINIEPTMAMRVERRLLSAMHHLADQGPATARPVRDRLLDLLATQ